MIYYYYIGESALFSSFHASERGRMISPLHRLSWLRPLGVNVESELFCDECVP